MKGKSCGPPELKSNIAYSLSSLILLSKNICDVNSFFTRSVFSFVAWVKQNIGLPFTLIDK
jgi:hypothetical protein